MKFRDTKRSYNIINHTQEPGVSLSASEYLRDQCPLGHDLTPLGCGVSNSLPTVRSLVHSFIPPTVCQSVLAYQDKDQKDTVLAFRDLRQRGKGRCVKPIRTA